MYLTNDFTAIIYSSGVVLANTGRLLLLVTGATSSIQVMAGAASLEPLVRLVLVGVKI
jgi:hypothetical protein